MLPLSYIPEKPVRLNRELLRYRASLVKVQTGIKNKIHTIYLYYHCKSCFLNLCTSVRHLRPSLNLSVVTC